MKKLTFAKLQSIFRTTNNPSKKFRHLSNIWLSRDKKVLCFSMYESQGVFEGKYLVGTIHVNFSGKVIKVDDRRYDKDDQTFKKVESKILGLTVDLSSFKKSWENIIHDSPDSLSDRKVLGQINKVTGKVSLYKKENLTKLLKFKTTYETNNKRGWDYYGRHDYTETFMDLLKNNSDKISRFDISTNGMTRYSVSFKVGSLNLSLELSQFFNYELTAYVSHETHGAVRLIGDDISELSQVMKELRSGKLSNKTKARMASGVLGKNTHFELLSDNQVECTTSFSSAYFPKAPRGVYKFVIDFSKKQVSVNESRSSKFIPDRVKQLQERLFTK